MTALAEEHVALLMPATDSSCDDSGKARAPRRWRRTALRAMLAAYIVIVLVQVQGLIDDKINVARFTVDLAAVEGLNATVVGHRTAISPVFNLTARVENPRVLTAWCGGGRAVVSYGGVSLAWGSVPGFCAPRNGGAAEVVVEARGSGVGLSDGLRRSFVEELDAGTARVAVEMRLQVYDGDGWLRGLAAPPRDGVSMLWRELPLPGRSQYRLQQKQSPYVRRGTVCHCRL